MTTTARRQMLTEASRRYRARNPEYRERERLRKRRAYAELMSTPEGRRRERDRIAHYRATHQAHSYISQLQSRRRRQVAQGEESS